MLVIKLLLEGLGLGFLLYLIHDGRIVSHRRNTKAFGCSGSHCTLPCECALLAVSYALLL